MSFSDVVKMSKTKSKVDKNSFERGFFYFFGLAPNPFDKAIKDIYLADLQSSLKKDWEVVSNDFNKVFTKEVENFDVEK